MDFMITHKEGGDLRHCKVDISLATFLNMLLEDRYKVIVYFNCASVEDIDSALCYDYWLHESIGQWFR